MSLFLKRSLVQISMVSSRLMSAKNQTISKLPMMLQESCSTISVEKLNESLAVYLLVVNGSKICTKNFSSLYASVYKEDKVGLKSVQPSKRFLCILQEPYRIPGLVHTGFRCLRVSSDMLPESASFLYILSMRFSRSKEKL